MLQTEDSISINDIFAILIKRQRIIMFATLPAIVAAVSLALLLPSEYESFARIDIDLDVGGSDKRNQNLRTLEPITVSAYAEQYVAQLRDRVLKNNLKQFLEDEDVFSGDYKDLSERERIRMVRKGFFVEMVKQPATNIFGTRIELASGFKTGFRGSDPKFVYAVAAYTAKAFLEEDRTIRIERASSTASFLEDQISNAEAETVEWEQRIAEFKVQNACCLPELKVLNMGVIERTEHELESLHPRIRILAQERTFIRSQLDEILKQNVSTDRLAILEEEYVTLVANYGSDHPDVVRVRREISAIASIGPAGDEDNTLLDLRVQLAEAKRRYSDVHPDVIRLSREIAVLEAEKPGDRKIGQNRLLENPRYLRLREEINAIDSELGTLRAQAPELRQRIEEYEDRLMRTPQVESEYQALTRQLETATVNVENLQERSILARQTEALESTDFGARLVQAESATMPIKPSGPARVIIGLVGAFLACSLGLGVVLVAEMTDATVRRSRDVLRIMQVVPIATIPVVHNSLSTSNDQRVFLLRLGTTLMITFVVIFLLISTLNL